MNAVPTNSEVSHDCWMAPSKPPCFVQLGRFGDLMILMPGWKKFYDTTGIKPVVLTSQHYGTILNGVSYVESWIEPLHWLKDVGKAREMATEKYGSCIVPKWWDDPHAMSPNAPGIDKRWDSYMLAQWRNAGFDPNAIGQWPLVFDQRNPERETALVKSHLPSTRRILLMNLVGQSSPLPSMNLVFRLLFAQRLRFAVLDLSKIRAARIYDLLALFERAVLLVTCDTSTLHLASACNVPMIALVANGGGGSIVNGNAILKLRYHEIPNKLHLIDKVLRELKI